MDVRVFSIGIVIAMIGTLGATGYIPFPSLGQQSTVCAQSIVQMTTICSSALSTGMDSISYSGVIIAPVSGGNPVSISQSQSQGTLIGRYFLTSGTTLRSSSATYCSGQGCSPNIPLSTSNSASSSVVGLYLLTAQSPSMAVGTYYTYQFSITDSSGASSSMSGTVVPVAATPTWTAIVKTLNGTYNIGSSGGGGVSGVNVYNSEAAFFQVQITNNAVVSGVTIAVSPSGQTISLSPAGGNLWQGTSTFAVGAYVLTGTISNSVKVTAFSIRLTSINANTFTQPTLTTNAATCTSATQTIGNIVYVCSTTTSARITISSSGCYTATNAQTTCSSGSSTCDANGCTSTGTTTSGSGSSSTTVTSSTTSSTSTTQVCQNPTACPGKGINMIALATVASGIALALVGVFLKKEDYG